MYIDSWIWTEAFSKDLQMFSRKNFIKLKLLYQKHFCYKRWNVDRYSIFCKVFAFVKNRLDPFLF